jgi:Putative peptidoglycan binding domain
LPIDNRIIQLALALCVTLVFAGATSATTTSTTTTKPKSKHSQTSKTHSASSSSSSSKTHSKHSTKTAAKSTPKSHGQRGIDEERTREIQSALIQQHYLTGEPTGAWDQSTKDALTKYQADNGWQTKLTPDSRALIKLGLGPDHKGLLNPDTASIPSPHELGMDTAQPGGASDQQ